jgi:hypothetical protein
MLYLPTAQGGSSELGIDQLQLLDVEVELT